MPTDERPLSQVSIRLLLVVSIVLNFVGIGLSEVQRWSLANLGNDRTIRIAERIDQMEIRLLDLATRRAVEDRELVTAQRLESARARDAARAYQTATLQLALEKYHRDHQTYPTNLPSNPISDLQKALVDNKYLTSLPDDPLGRKYWYTSNTEPDGVGYGIKVPLEIGGDCIVGAGPQSSSWWGGLRRCPFETPAKP